MLKHFVVIPFQNLVNSSKLIVLWILFHSENRHRIGLGLDLIIKQTLCSYIRQTFNAMQPPSYDQKIAVNGRLSFQMMETNTWNLWIATNLDEGCNRKRRTEAVFGICGNIPLRDFKEQGLIIPDPTTTNISIISCIFISVQRKWFTWLNRLSEMEGCPKEQKKGTVHGTRHENCK